MTISIITLFPEMFEHAFGSSIIKRAIQNHILDLRLINMRDFSRDAYKSVDDHPYGGGVGMILRVDIIDRAINAAKSTSTDSNAITVLMDPQGTPYTQKKARELSTHDHIILVCGHYEGVDERVRMLVDEEISIGDYILTGGEIPAMAISDSVVRLLPGTLSKTLATRDESFESSLLEHPQYTRPDTYEGMEVPDVLRSGNHVNIGAWRQQEAKKRTKKRRPDLLTEKKDRLSHDR